jgi:choline dehydrogenase-like flavoprotein
MFVDARTLPASESLEVDICIVGSGPAGIALATALSGFGCRIVLAESGGLEPDPKTQALNDGESVGLGYRINESRPRYFGGAANQWAGNCRPLDASDFKSRPWIPHSGWPFSRADLEPYYERARNFCGVDQREPRLDDIRARGGSPVPWSNPLETAVWQVSPYKRFGNRFCLEFANATGIKVLLYANLIHLVEAQDGHSIGLARFSTLAGNRVAVTARCYVLACGGIENARLLLTMVSERHPAGLGNQNDLVGRFFTEHPEMPVGALVHNRPPPPGLGRVISTGSEEWLQGYRLTDNIQKSAQIANVAFWPLMTMDLSSSAEPAGLAPLFQDVSSRLGGLSPCGPQLQTILTITLEQSPNLESRIMLSQARDNLGMPRVRLDWRLNNLDRRSFITALKVIGREAGRQRIGRFRLRLPLRTLDLDRPESVRFDLPITGPSTAHNQLDTELRWGCHHMGTTRMHMDPRHGVVDPQGRVHGINNLYIAGSSIFPNVGISNPTLTIIALALRLADHLNSGRHMISSPFTRTAAISH